MSEEDLLFVLVFFGVAAARTTNIVNHPSILL